MLIIGTTNKKRFENIRSLVYKVDSDLDCVQRELNIDETGTTSQENSLIKAKAYYEKFHTNVLCIDDAIELEDKNIISPGARIHRDDLNNQLSNHQIIDHWMKVLKIDSKTGRLIKSFVLIDTKGEVFRETINYNCTLVFVENVNYETNPMNNFLIPQGFSKSISNFTEEDMAKFREQQVSILRKLLIHTN